MELVSVMQNALETSSGQKVEQISPGLLVRRILGAILVLVPQALAALKLTFGSQTSTPLRTPCSPVQLLGLE